MMKICIIIPAHNEGKHIGSLIDSLRLNEHDVVIINDGSTDNTSSIAEEKGAFVLNFEERSGKGCALRRGFAYALERNYDGVITMDGDGQHDVEDIVLFTDAAQKNRTDIVTGNRMDNPKAMPFIRYCTNKFMSWLISLACGQSIKDTQCGFRYISREILEKLDLSCTDFEIETEILMQACKKGFNVHSVPIKTIYCDEKSNINPIKDTIRFFSYFIKESFSSKA